MNDMEDMIRKLLLMRPLRGEVISSMIANLELPRGSRGLDAGCGIGCVTFRLADPVGPTGMVTGFDLSTELLTFAKSSLESSTQKSCVEFREGNLKELPFDDELFDWVWSADCAGYAPSEAPQRVMEELTRVLRPGGLIGIAAWSSEMLLPGYPALEAKLRNTTNGLLPFSNEMPPEQHIHRALEWFRKAGLVERKAQAFVGCTQAPLSPEQRSALECLIAMRWDMAAQELDAESRKLYQRLTDFSSGASILDHPDYCSFIIYSLYSAKKPTPTTL